MKLVLIFGAMLLVALPAAAADRMLEVAAWYVFLDPSSEGTFNSGSPEEPFDVKFDSDTGYGVSATLFLGRLGAELGIAQVDSPVALEARGRVANLAPRKTKLMPITGTLQYHFAKNAMIDPYIGVGAMYLLVGDLSGGRETDLAVEEIDSSDLGYLFSAGLAVELTEAFGLLLDAKYVPSGTSAPAILNDERGTRTDVTLSPIIVSVGVSYRF